MRVFFLILVAIYTSNTAIAATVSASAVLSGSVFRYDYTIENDNGTAALIGFELLLPVDVFYIQAPIGWVFNSFTSSGMTTVQWFGETDQISPGGTLSGFGFDAAVTGLGWVPVTITDSDFGTVTDRAMGPTPEPGTLTMFSSMLLIPLCYRYLLPRKGRRRAVSAGTADPARIP